ncbi:CBL-interacting serine/threonine-protein kinase 20 [Dinochytrium kinnereticum]|nr:CBL-interacting serine/threonine-protein kinase 20 [Dinochytrium kinnereticum]
MRQIRHKNIVNMQDAMASKNRIYIFQELITGGEILYHLDTGVVKITDFGLAVMVQEGTLLYRAAGTPSYLAPEVLKSCGVVLYIFLAGQYRCDLKYPSDMPDLIKDLLKRVLVSDPSKRLKAQDVLEHEWTRRPSKTVNTLELLQMSELFDIGAMLSRTRRRSTKFMTRKSQDEVIKRLTAILCTLPLTFTAIESQKKINIQAPFANEMIVMVVQLHVLAETLLLVDFHRLKVVPIFDSKHR